MRYLKNIKLKMGLLFHSLFRGLKAADDVMQTQAGSSNGVEINQDAIQNSVYSDMLEGVVTKEVEELRDKHYRVLKEADKYKADSLTLKEVEIIEDGKKKTVLQFSGGVTKKTKEDFMKHPPVFERGDDFILRTIQDVKQFEKTSMFAPVMPKGLYDFDTNITIERNIIPRFEIEKFATKIVARNKKNTERAEVDIYLPTHAGQFSKIDAILISNLYTMFDTKNFRSDITDINTIQWYADKAWNADDLCSFKYDDVTPSDINVFDGSFVLTFDCHIVEDGVDITAKYKTKELDEKYETKSAKSSSVDIFAAERRTKEEKKEINTNNIESTLIKL